MLITKKVVKTGETIGRVNALETHTAFVQWHLKGLVLAVGRWFSAQMKRK